MEDMNPQVVFYDEENIANEPKWLIAKRIAWVIIGLCWVVGVTMRLLDYFAVVQGLMPYPYLCYAMAYVFEFGINLRKDKRHAIFPLIMMLLWLFTFVMKLF